MKMRRKIAITLTVSLLFCFFCIGYALVQDQLNIFGTLSFDGSTVTMLDTGANINAQLAALSPTRIVFDRFANQSTAINYLGLAWAEGTEIQSEDSPAGSLRLFFDAESGTAYILSKNSLDLLANPDSAGAFSNLTSLTEVVFNCFNTSNAVNMQEMFYGCTALHTIWATASFEVSAVTSSSDMFTGCYALVGGEGTRVYEKDATATTQPVDHTNARIDGENGLEGYFTDTTGEITYFRSNLLKPASENATYALNGDETWFTVSNALDSKIYSYAEMQYSIATYVQKSGTEWTLHKTELASFAAGSYQVRQFSVTPITDGETVYDSVKIVATCLSGQLESIEAVISFTYGPVEVEHTYESGRILLCVTTRADAGKATFTWNAGLTADNSDPNLIFTDVQNGTTTLQADLNARTRYEFLFFVTDDTLLGQLEADPTLVTSMVTVTMP